MNNAHNSNTILALEAVLRMNEAVEDLLRQRANERRKEFKFLSSTREKVQILSWESQAKRGSPCLCASTKRLTEIVMEQFQVRQAREDMAEYLLLVASLDDRRFGRTQSWLDTTIKACDLRDAWLKECLSQVLIAEAAKRKLVPLASGRFDPGRKVSETISKHGRPRSEFSSLQPPPTGSLPAWAVGAATTKHGSIQE